MTNLDAIDKRLEAAKDARQLSDAIRDVRARLAVEHADPGILEAVDELERRHTGRLYIGARAG